MEFGIIIQSPVPKMWRDNPQAEHQSLMDDLDYAVAAEAAGFKYVWATEHHFLDEYSHLSENAVTMGYLAHATTKIHIGSAIMNPLPQVNHPAKVAERVTMLDHYSHGRFEFGTGRGAGTHEILGFLPGMRDLTHTREIWEDVIAEFPKMWLQDEYEGYEGKYWSLPPRKILPKPYRAPHPAMWYAAGNVDSWAMAGRRGLGVLGFSVQSLEDLAKVIDGYKKAITTCEPIGAFANDNIMVMGVPFVCADEKRALELARVPNEYFSSLVYRYHDTFPHPEGVPYWPETLPAPTDDEVKMIAASMSPDNALAACKAWEAAGADQIVFAPQLMPKADVLESIRLIGEHIIPKLDTDPVHRTDRLRDAAVAAAK